MLRVVSLNCATEVREITRNALTCASCGSPDPDPTGDCETAFAYGGSGIATCFLDIDEDLDGKSDFMRWGWTNSLQELESQTWPIYAGAGQCDTSKERAPAKKKARANPAKPSLLTD